MGRSTSLILVFINIVILLVGLFYMPNILLLLLLTLMYAFWELWDEHFTLIHEKQKEHEDLFLYDPNYNLIIQ